MSDPASARSTTIRTDDGAAGSWERLLFRPVGLWVVLLLLLLSLAAVVIFGSAVRHQYTGGTKLGRLGPAVEAVAGFPSTARQAIFGLRGDKYDLAAAENRHAGATGFSFAYAPGQRPELGYVLVNRYDGDRKRSVSELWDLNSQRRVHTWDFGAVDEIWQRSRLESDVDFRVDARATRFQSTHALLDAEGGLLVAAYSPLVRADACSTLSLFQDSTIYHHSMERDDAGNLWIPQRIEPKTVDLGDARFWDDGLTQLSPDGEVMFERSVTKILESNGLTHLVRGRGEAHFDPIHLNDIQPVLADGKHWRRGDLWLSLRNQSMVLLYRPSTDKVLWYRSGPWLHQHDVNVLDDHRISVFDNHAMTVGVSDWVVRGSNRLLVADLDTGEVSSPWQSGFERLEIRTATAGRGEAVGAEAFVEESEFGRLVQFTADGTIVWQYINRARDGKVYLLNWSRLVPRDLGDRAAAALRARRCG